MPPPRPLAVAVLLAALAAGALPASPAASGFRADWLKNFDEAADKATRLVRTMPGAALAWRPAAGVRSGNQVIAHLALTNYYLPRYLGAPAPAEITRELELEDDPVRLRRVLAESLAHARAVVVDLDDAALERKVRIFGGREVTTRELLLSALGHLHEHLGQLIAYARANGVVPPWSAVEVP
jgi:uncharacterized damage-inducible protein DinB